MINLLQIEFVMSSRRLRIPHFHADGKQKGENYEVLGYESEEDYLEDFLGCDENWTLEDFYDSYDRD